MMNKTYQKYLIKKFLKKIFHVSLIFLSLVLILNIFEEISFLKDLGKNFFLPFLLTVLNAPSVLFEIFPFIFLISSLLFFLELIQKNELEVLKVNGLNNLKIIKLLFFTSLITGFFLILVYYNFSAKLKFVYLELKNNYSQDDKYLAMVTENGIWIKDEFEENTYIVNAKKINKKYLEDVIISEFNLQFDLIKMIRSPNVDISTNDWIILNPIVFQDNKRVPTDNNIILRSHFNQQIINQLFNDLFSLNILELLKLTANYEELGYSTTAVRSHLNKIFSFPVYLSIMSIFSAIIMLNIKKNRPMIFYIILSVFLSVVIYYFNYLFNLMGETGKIPIYISNLLPLLLLIIFIFIGLIRVDEK